MVKAIQLLLQVGGIKITFPPGQCSSSPGILSGCLRLAQLFLACIQQFPGNSYLPQCPAETSLPGQQPAFQVQALSSDRSIHKPLNRYLAGMLALLKAIAQAIVQQ